MNTFLKLSIFYLLLLVITVSVVLNFFYKEIKPSIRQASEETMIDNANLLAEFVAPYFLDGDPDFSELYDIHGLFKQRKPNAQIWSYLKNQTNLEFYITDERGFVLFHSTDKNLIDRDFSLWRDVAYTLKGKYGARTTRADPDNERSSGIHIAAPILIDGEIFGVLTVIQPHLGVEPFIGPAEKKVVFIGVIALSALMIIGLLLIFRFNGMLSQLTNYVDRVRKGEEVEKLHFSDTGFNELADTLHKMREELDGKEYVDQYIHTLTHELKTPLSAISASAQILESDLNDEDKQHFLQNIEAEVDRLKNLIERLLLLASIENKQKPQFKIVNLEKIVSEEVKALTPLLTQKNISVKINKPEVFNPEISGDDFLLRTAIKNLIDNAIDFSYQDTELTIELASNSRNFTFAILNQGELIPDYAFERLFDKFFSRPRQSSGRKSSGLGLCLVKEIAHLHNGDIQLTNFADDNTQGVKAELIFNLTKIKIHR